MTSESLLSYYSFLLCLFHGAINLIIVSDEINQSIMRVSGVVAFFDNLTMKNIGKTSVGMSNWCYQSKCSPDGAIQWLLVKPWTSSIGRCARYCTAASQWPSKRPALLVYLLIVVCLSVAWRMLGQYGASSHLMPASTGFQSSPEHATLGDTPCYGQL